jgi:hypothetical protein
MDFVGLAGLSCQRNGSATADGAALTYARRYALFTLVGIAGEDDLDAPDLEHVAGKAGPPNGSAGQTNGHAHATGASGNSRRRAPVTRLVLPILTIEPSGQLQDRLLGELSRLQSSDEAANWANRSLPAKNTLIVADAQLVEDGFRIKMAALEEAQPGECPEAAHSPNPAIATTQESLPTGRGTGLGRIAAKTIRLRDKDHRKFVASQPCLVCGRSPADAHHLRFAQPRALGRKVSDEFTVPVCRVHHRELHRHGDEAAWWQKIKIDPLPIARRLWQQARSNGPLMEIRDPGPQLRQIVRSGTRLSRSLIAAEIWRMQLPSLPIGPPTRDLVPTSRSQPAQCAPKYRSDPRRRQTPVAAKRHPARIVR